MLKLLYTFSVFIFIDTYTPTNDLIKNNLKGKVKTIEYSSKEKSVIYNYNEDGYLISKIDFPYNNKSVILNREIRKYEYYNNQKIKKVEVIDYESNTSHSIKNRHVEVYNSSGNMISDTYYLTGFGDNYNGQGVREFDPYKDIETVHKCTYNKKTKEKTCYDYLAGNTLSCSWSKQYDSEEDLISYKMIIGKELAFKYINKKNYQNGLKVEHILELDNNNDTVAKYISKYDKYNNLIEYIKRSKKPAVIKDNFFYKYDKNNNWISRKKYYNDKHIGTVTRKITYY